MKTSFPNLTTLALVLLMTIVSCKQANSGPGGTPATAAGQITKTFTMASEKAIII